MQNMPFDVQVVDVVTAMEQLEKTINLF
jgi:hypothetical protein